MEIRAAAEADWPGIYPFYSTIMNEGRTYAFPAGQSLDEARPWWMEQPPGLTVVAVEGGRIVGSAKMGPNRPGRGSGSSAPCPKPSITPITGSSACM